MVEACQLANDSSDDVDTLITFRAIALAAFLSTAADVSCVVGTPLGKKIVQAI